MTQQFHTKVLALGCVGGDTKGRPYQVELRPYQIEVADKVTSELSKYTGPFVVNLFMGLGKSHIIAELARRVGKVLVLVPSKELLEQNLEKLNAVGCEVGVYSASMGSKVIKDITIATIGSIYKSVWACKQFELVIVDECQQVPLDTSSMYMKLLSKIGAKVVGFTGTPFRLVTEMRRRGGQYISTTLCKALTEIGVTAGKRVGRPYWKDIISNMSYKDGLKKGYLAPIRYQVKHDIERARLLQVNSKGSEYTPESVQVYELSGIDLLVTTCDYALKRSITGSVLVYVSSISTADVVAERLRLSGIKACYVSGDTPKKERSAIIQGFKDGSIQVVVNVGVLVRGFDYPELDSIVFARPTMSLEVWSQSLARGIRVGERKKVCQVYDISGTFGRFGGIEDIRMSYWEGKWWVMGSGGSLMKIGEVDVTRFVKSRWAREKG